MSKQLTSFNIYPLTENTVKVVNHQDADYALAANENKAIVRVPDHFPLNPDTIHYSQNDDGGIITEVVSSDPLTIVTSGFYNDLDGYDGLVVSADGYSHSRGVIRTKVDQLCYLNNPAYASVGTNYYLFGGCDSVDGYTSEVFYSTNGKKWVNLGDAPWSPRANAIAICSEISGSTADVWICGGFYNSTARQDIWHGTITVDTETITWDVAELDTGITQLAAYSKGTYANLSGDHYLITGNLKYNLSTTTATPTAYFPNGDGYDSVIHYDSPRSLLWQSKDGRHFEKILDSTNGTIVSTTVPFGFTHRQATASTNWQIKHDLNTRNLAVIVYDDDNNLTVPREVVWISNSRIDVNFTTARTGRALCCVAKYYSGATWTSDGYYLPNAMWFSCDTSGGIIEPAVINNAGGTLELAFAVSRDGYLTAREENTSGVTGRQYYSEHILATGDNNITTYQTGTSHLYNLRDSTGAIYGLFIPNSVSFNATTDINVTTAGAKIFASYDLRCDGYSDLNEPFNPEYANIGFNAQDDQIGHIVSSGGVWRTENAGLTWTRASAVGAEISTTDTSWVHTNSNIIGTKNYDYKVIRSLDAGESFEPYSLVRSNTITFYDDLCTGITTAWKLFAYQRPSDVIWESNYGHLSGTILDRYDTHYLLSNPHSVSGSASEVDIALNANFTLSITAHTLKDYYLIVYDATGTTVVDFIQIYDNTAATSGGTLKIFLKTPLSFTPSGSTNKAQIVFPRPEGAEYFSAITRNSNLDYTVYYETDGKAFILANEQAQDWYADLLIKDHLPSYVASTENLARMNTNLAELNRLRVAAAQHYNDAQTLPEELLYRLGEEIGLRSIRDIDIFTARRLISNYFSKVHAYGPCIDGINNLISLTLGENSGVEATNLGASGVCGNGIQLNISAFADYSWDYSATDNIVRYLSNKYTLRTLISQVPAEFSAIIHRRLYHMRDNMLDAPVLITNFAASASVGYVVLDTSDRQIIDWGLGTNSVFAIYDEIKSRKIEWLVNRVKEMLPYYVKLYLV